VIEIGCGDGRLTWVLAERARKVIAIDPKRSDIAAARRVMPGRLKGRVRFDVAQAENLPFRDGEFNVAVFSWSL
jgi:ubiquinone/menaquinone biosynthesis C-methylase UbiE